MPIYKRRLIPAAVKQAVSNLGGLEVPFINELGRNDKLDFDAPRFWPSDAKADFMFNRFSNEEKYLKTDLYFIASWDDGWAKLLMGANGSVIAVYEDDITSAGYGIEEALNTILMGLPGKSI